MTEASTYVNFEKIVEWAYSTLPEKIRNLPDFPGIQVVEEPPEDVLKEIRQRSNWPKEWVPEGLFSGFRRTEPRHFQSRIAPDLIFIFRGPILRCSRGNLPAEVKQVVWHEVAHWLGHSEEEVRELGLSRSREDAANRLSEIAASEIALLQELRKTPRFPHSYRNATTGSTLVARWAGT